MENEIYVNIKAKLKAKPKKLTSLDQWLFVAVNTTKSHIDNTCKNNLDNVMMLSDCNSTSQLQHEFNIIQGKFGREPICYTKFKKGSSTIRDLRSYCNGD